MLQYGRHERYSSTVQLIFCACSPRRQPRDNTGQISFSFENQSLLLSSLQVQKKAVGFLPSAWGKTKGAPAQTEAFGSQTSAERAFAILFPFRQI